MSRIKNTTVIINLNLFISLYKSELVDTNDYLNFRGNREGVSRKVEIGAGVIRNFVLSCFEII